MNLPDRPLQWDIFCKVIDNFGDIGICWRLSADLASRGHQVRLWADDASALAWMAPQGVEGVQVLPWGTPLQMRAAALEARPSDVMVEAFGCDTAPEFIAACARQQGAAGRSGKKPVWLNLEYLSAESYAARSHGLPSPVQAGPGAGWTKWFFYPGFTQQTGGLLREPDLPARQAAFDRAAWLRRLGIDWQGEALVSLFCYEPTALASLLEQFDAQGLQGRPVRLLVAAGRAENAVKALFKGKKDHEKGLQANTDGRKLLSISYLPLVTQADFDHLLWACDLNFVRGEDSIVRALWAGKPFVWQIYPQDDGVHRTKLDAFLDEVQAPASWRAFHHLWNASDAPVDSLPALGDELTTWQDAAVTARARLTGQLDLTSALLEFVQKKPLKSRALQNQPDPPVMCTGKLHVPPQNMHQP